MPFVWFILIGLFDARMFYRIVVLCVFMIGSVDSAPPEVGLAPKFRRPVIKDRVGLLNESIQLQCKVKGIPRPYLIWLYNGEPIGINERFQVTKYSLWIHVLSLSDMGNYSCKAWNKYGIIWGNITLRVLESTDKLYDDYYDSNEQDFSEVMSKPEWPRKTYKVDYLARPATQSVVMRCETHGYPSPNITWYKDKKKIAPIPEKVMMSEWELEIKDLTMLDKGNYTCIVQNELGALNWTYKLKVTQHLPVVPILEDLKNQTVVEGDNVTFTCVILMSDSQPLLQWLKHYKANNSFVNDDGEPHVHVLKQSGFKKPIDDPQYLNFTSVTKNDTGWYTCLVANSIGMNYRSAYLKVLSSCGSVPTAPTNGGVAGTPFLVGDTVTYSCNTGFVMTGSATATCQADGTWDNTATVCYAESSYVVLVVGVMLGAVILPLIVALVVFLVRRHKGTRQTQNGPRSTQFQGNIHNNTSGDNRQPISTPMPESDDNHYLELDEAIREDTFDRINVDQLDVENSPTGTVGYEIPVVQRQNV